VISGMFCLNRRFKFHKRRQLLTVTSDKSLSIVPMRVRNPDRSPVGIDRGDAAPTPTGLAEIVGNDFPVLDATVSLPSNMSCHTKGCS
jgi:hypothetical protein